MTPLALLRYVWQHPSNRRRRVRTTAATVGWQLRKRLVKRPLDLHVYDGLRIRCHPDSYGAGVMIYTGGWPDYDEMHFVRRYLRAGDSFVDVGANIGIFTLLAAQCVGATGRVLALEAGRRAFERLRENLALNRLEDRVDARFVAVGAQSGTVRFLQQHDLINRLVVPADEQVAGSRMEEVPCQTLDELLTDRSYAMGKIDIEGAEMMAFRGGQQMLDQANPAVWLLELKGRLLERFGHSPEQLADLLGQHGYQLGIYSADANRLTFPPTPWQDHGNVLAIHQCRREEVERRLADTASGRDFTV